MKVSCDDHNGHNAAYMAKWDGTKWTKGSDWIEPIKAKVRPLIEVVREGICRRQCRLAEAHRDVRQALRDLTTRPLPASKRGEAFSLK